MRLLALLLLVAAAEDLTPREGSGWAGFKPGSFVRIKNTLELAELSVSEPLVASLPDDGSVEIAGPPEPLRFSAEGRLL